MWKYKVEIHNLDPETYHSFYLTSGSPKYHLHIQDPDVSAIDEFIADLSMSDKLVDYMMNYQKTKLELTRVSS